MLFALFFANVCFLDIVLDPKGPINPGIDGNCELESRIGPWYFLQSALRHASIERSQNNCDLATPAYIRKLYLPVARKRSTYTNVMHDKYSTCKQEHATCTCQIVAAQIADAGQLQANEARIRDQEPHGL